MSARTAGARPESPVALVTGASGGLGRAMAVRLDELGFRVAVHYRGAEEEARATAALLTHPTAIVGGDIGDWDDATRIHAETVAALGPVDVLVNNGGIRRDALMAMQDPASWEEVIRTNLLGAFHLSRLAVPGMLSRRWGRIVNVVSPSALIATPGQTAYSSSKAGLIGLTRTLAAECAPRGVTVNALSPGFVETGMTSSLPDAKKNEIRAKCPMRRFGTAEEVARALGFFIDLDYMTGQVVSVDGGVSIV